MLSGNYGTPKKLFGKIVWMEDEKHAVYKHPTKKAHLSRVMIIDKKSSDEVKGEGRFKIVERLRKGNCYV